MSNDKFCVNCKYYDTKDKHYHRCLVPAPDRPSLITGKVENTNRSVSCGDMCGNTGRCKPEGLLYDPKPDMFKQLLQSYRDFLGEQK